MRASRLAFADHHADHWTFRWQRPRQLSPAQMRARLQRALGGTPIGVGEVVPRGAEDRGLGELARRSHLPGTRVLTRYDPHSGRVWLSAFDPQMQPLLGVRPPRSTAFGSQPNVHGVHIGSISPAQAQNPVAAEAAVRALLSTLSGQTLRRESHHAGGADIVGFDGLDEEIDALVDALDWI